MQNGFINHHLLFLPLFLACAKFICSFNNFLTRAVLLLKSVDYGRMAEILVQRASSPDEFTRLTAITWVLWT